MEQDETAGEVAAMQFAGGMSIESVAAEWDREAEWVEAAIRVELLKFIPRRDGGLKPSRTEMRAERSEERAVVRQVQGKLEW